VEQLKEYTKLIVTGPPRSGTTIVSLILSKKLGYKFIDETLYNGSDQLKFAMLIHHQRKMVIHNTSFTKDIHDVVFTQPTCIVLVKRPIKDILDSLDNTIKFMHDDTFVGEDGMFNGFTEEARELIKKHFGYEGSDLTLPEVIYDHFEKHKKPTNNYFEVNYNDFESNELFIRKEARRKNFTHIKQIDFDPEYIDKRQGVVIL
jgi:hypothetical protein